MNVNISNIENMEKEAIQGLENPSARYYHANRERRSFLHIRSVSYSCRTREKSQNHSLEFASNIRAFLLNDQAFLAILENESERLRKSDYEYVFKVMYEKVFNKRLDRKEFESLSEAEQKHIRCEIAECINYSTPEEKNDMLGLNLAVSCKLRGYEKELFVLKALTEGKNPYWISRCCYHLQNKPVHPNPLDFNALLEMIRFKGG